jgi:uncharacterized protein (DUF1778 family)
MRGRTPTRTRAGLIPAGAARLATGLSARGTGCWPGAAVASAGRRGSAARLGGARGQSGAAAGLADGIAVGSLLYAVVAYNGGMATSARDDRLHLRLPAALRTRIDQAASAEGKTVTDFAVAALEARTEQVLADRRMFALDEAAWARLQELLDRPVQDKPELTELLDRKPPTA